MGIIHRSDSQWALPLHIVPKQNRGWRPCGDYRRLNDKTLPDRYPVPHIQDFSAHLAGNHVFSKVNLICGYHQIPIAANDIGRTAIISPFGLFEFVAAKIIKPLYSAVSNSKRDKSLTWHMK